MKELPGFESAQFDIPAKTAAIRGDLDPQAVVAALSRAGYPAVLKRS